MQKQSLLAEKNTTHRQSWVKSRDGSLQASLAELWLPDYDGERVIQVKFWSDGEYVEVAFDERLNLVAITPVSRTEREAWDHLKTALAAKGYDLAEAPAATGGRKRH